ncbi:MAG: hypothetical protein LBV00_12075 [Propionibacteriaceae bacterium]|jgi:hypothetical protein|nr:hypothetical protein [Propionibacteriaceae bacterium]
MMNDHFTQDEDSDGAPAPLAVAITGLVAGCPPDVQQYVFPPVPVPGHVWEDAHDVFSMAAVEFGQARNPGAALPFPVDEHPLLFIGAHVKSIMFGKRHAIGFLLTNREILVRNSTVKDSEQAAIVFPLAPGFQVSEAADRFDWSWLERLARHDGISLDELRRRLTLVLAQAVGLVLPTLGMTSTLGAAPEGAERAGVAEPPVRRTASDMAGRLRELGLTDQVKVGSDPKQAKHLVKLGKKVGVPPHEPIIVTVSDSTLAGPYGVVITDSHVYSRDLMEDPVPPTPRSSITPSEVMIESDTLVLGPGQVHTIPSTVPDTHRDALRNFIRELLAGDLR